MFLRRCRRLATLGALCLRTLSGAPADDGLEFFEKKIRPVLVKKCYSCHGPEMDSPFGELRVDTRDALLRGGSRGPAVIPGKPESSLFYNALTFDSRELQMPPMGKLSDSEIEDVRRWIEMGAPDPRQGTVAARRTIDLDRGRTFWSFRPIRRPQAPRVDNPEWLKTGIDAFILKGLEVSRMVPAHPARPVDWLRRVTLDLTGLPPTLDEIEAFAADTSQAAFERVVEGLLASPHYGERWGRHWLDLVRFAETNGHEFDNDKLGAWRYRDYVIRAFNQDVPYDRFVREHVAGDLMPDKRLSADGSFWESPLATGYYWFGEILNSPTDSVQRRADEVDNQIDVLGKTFQAMTVACARCHDHKFDPIPTADYYSLAGILHATGVQESVVDSPTRRDQIRSGHDAVAEANTRIRSLLQQSTDPFFPNIRGYLMAAVSVIEGRSRVESWSKRGLNQDLLKARIDQLDRACADPTNLFYPLARMIDQHGHPWRHPFPQELEGIVADLTGWNSSSPDQLVFEDFEDLSFESWTVAGQAFSNGPVWRLPANQPLQDHRGQGVASSFGAGADGLTGSLTSEEFVVPGRWLHVRMAGTPTESNGEKAPLRVSLVNGGYKSRNFVPRGDSFRWYSSRLEIDYDRICWFEIVDRSSEGHLVVDSIVFTDSPEPPRHSDPNPLLLEMLAGGGVDGLEDLVERYDRLFASVAGTRPGDASHSWVARAANPFHTQEAGLGLFNRKERKRILQLAAERDRRGAAILPSIFALTARDRKDAGDIRIHVRGDHSNLGEEVPRGFLQVLPGQAHPPLFRTSGRLELADLLTSKDNPLLARVLVNRVWRHHFGRGLVATVDNFGSTGARPSHSQLLDYLASQFVTHGWSIKNLHRWIVLSSTYRMSSQADPAAVEKDPLNQKLHHFPVRRMEAETIRDSLLAVSGRLDRKMYGPSVAPHISQYQDGRGKPVSGALDGEGRRSLYIQVRRNFVTPLFLAFDYPPPISTIGQRSTSTVPSQALMMLNNAFVRQQSQLWGDRILEMDLSPQSRIERMYLEAFSRNPTAGERARIDNFLSEQEEMYRDDSSVDARRQAWRDVAHVLLNSPEFIYVR